MACGMTTATVLLYPAIQPATRRHVVTKVWRLIPACPLDGSCLFSLISGLIRELQPDLACCARLVSTASVNPVWDNHGKGNDGENSARDIRETQQIPFVFLSSLPNLLWGRGVGRTVVQVVGYYNVQFKIRHPRHSTRCLLFYSRQTHVLDGSYRITQETYCHFSSNVPPSL